MWCLNQTIVKLQNNRNGCHLSDDNDDDNGICNSKLQVTVNLINLARFGIFYQFGVQSPYNV